MADDVEPQPIYRNMLVNQSASVGIAPVGSPRDTLGHSSMDASPSGLPRSERQLTSYQAKKTIALRSGLVPAEATTLLSRIHYLPNRMAIVFPKRARIITEPKHGLQSLGESQIIQQ